MRSNIIKPNIDEIDKKTEKKNISVLSLSTNYNSFTKDKI